MPDSCTQSNSASLPSSPLYSSRALTRETPDIILQLIDRLIERLEAAISTSQHDGAFHGGQYMRCERSSLDISRQSIRGILDKPSNRIAPCFEIFDDQPPSRRLAVADFESQISDGTAQFKLGCFQ